jgi:hypothetical protein
MCWPEPNFSAPNFTMPSLSDATAKSASALPLHAAPGFEFDNLWTLVFDFVSRVVVLDWGWDWDLSHRQKSRTAVSRVLG